MKKILLLLVLSLIASKAYAAGGACPTNNGYVNPITFAPTTLAAFGITNCYYIAANGSDGNDGKTESTPWLHSPAMPACSSVCNTVTPAPGMGFIHRGGDVWHEGNTGASPTTGQDSIGGINFSGFLITTNGTATNQIYWGIDQTWFTGANWHRPIITGDNPLSTTGVAACQFPNQLHMVDTDAHSFFVIDDFEFTGGCWSGTQSGSQCCFIVLYSNNQANSPINIYWLRNYIHGWTHVTFNCTSSGGNPVGNCGGAFGLSMGAGSNHLGTNVGTVIAYNVVDGSDSDQHSLNPISFGGYDIHMNYLGQVAGGVVVSAPHAFWGNLLEFIAGNGDNQSHPNCVEFNSEQFGVQNVVYWNVIRNCFTFRNGEKFQMAPNTGANLKDLFFGNVFYNITPDNSNYFDYCTIGFGSGCGNSPPVVIDMFNNALIMPSPGSNTGPGVTGATLNLINNYTINPNGSPPMVGANGGVVNTTTSLIRTPTQANTDGMTATQSPLPFFPVSQSSPTVKQGTNLFASECQPLINSTDQWLHNAGIACSQTSGFGVTYDKVAHQVTGLGAVPNSRPANGGGNWDIGPWQLVSGESQVPQPSCSPIGGTYAGAQNVTCNPQANGPVLCFTTDGSAPQSNGAGGCSNGTAVHTWTTNFPNTENPISQNSYWLNGALNGGSWCDSETTPGKVFGVGPCPNQFDDATSVLDPSKTGQWGTAQVATATVYVQTLPNTAYFPEIELRLNTTITNGSITGYEADCSVGTSVQHPSPGFAYVRWNGPPGNFTFLTQLIGQQFACNNGDTLTASNDGAGHLQILRNGIPIPGAAATDTTYTGGSVGVGFNAQEGNNYPLSGFVNFIANDLQGGIPIPSSLTLKVIAGQAGFLDSSVVTNVYVIGGTPNANTPVCTPISGLYAVAQVITCTNPSATPVMCYTLDGSAPATNGGTGCTRGAIYNTTVTVPNSLVLTIVAGGTSFTDSSPAVLSYVIGVLNPALPQILLM